MDKDEVQSFFDELQVQNPEEQSLDFDTLFAKENEVKEEQPSQEGETVNTPDEEELPFNKNPKIKRFIERQAKKIAEEEIARLGVTRQEEQPMTVTEVNSDIPAEWLLAYGDSDQSRQAWNLQQKLIADAVSRAKEESVKEFQSKIEQEKEQESQFESFIQNSLEDIEDMNGIDLTSNTPSAKKARVEFLELVEKLSPKDQNGNVSNFADFNEVYNIYQAIKAKESNEVTSQKKSIASRSMMKSNETKVVDLNAPKQNMTFNESIVDMLFKK